MSKRDRQGVRKASDIEQKYKLNETGEATRLIAEAKVVAERAAAAAEEVSKVYQQFSGQSSFMENVTVDYAKGHSIVRVFRDRYDGGKQYPFVYVPYALGQDILSAQDIARRDGWYLVTNGGMVSDGVALGMVIENGIVYQNIVNGTHRPLVIDANGELRCVAYDEDASSLAGIVSAVCGYGAIIEDYNPTNEVEDSEAGSRQIIGQFGNGDYAIITCEGGWTIADAQDVCVELGLRFAYALEGGSADTALGKKTLCSAGAGNFVANYIVFNGTDNFAVPG